MEETNIKEVAMRIALDHHLSDYPAGNPLEVFESMAEDDIVIWQPFEDYSFEDVTEFISSLAWSIESKVNKLGDK